MATQMNRIDFLVQKNDLAKTEFREVLCKPLSQGQIRLSIDRFAFTSNNISYAQAGDALNYWAFFPAPDGFGSIPVWGFATVMESKVDEVAIGEIIWGYYPMSTHVVLEPKQLTSRGFIDGAFHRQAQHIIYNQYTRCQADAWHEDGQENLEALLRPLFATSWLVEDFLADQNFFEAETILLSSASSKTAYATAVQLQHRANIQVVGLTSAAHQKFCQSLGCYHQVLTYQQLAEIPEDSKCLYIDFSGNAKLRSDIHMRFQHLKYDCAVGVTHFDQQGSAKGLPGPRATFFFAPAQVAKRSSEWGNSVLMQRIIADWKSFIHKVSNLHAPWLSVETHLGPAAVSEIYSQVLSGNVDPKVGLMLSLSKQKSSHLSMPQVPQR
jgi:hypothetical protein